MLVAVLSFTAPIVPFLAGMYHSFFYPYADHPYKEEKFFVYMHKMMLLGMAQAFAASIAAQKYAPLSIANTVILVVLANIIAGYDALIRLRPYGPWRYARLRAYFNYEKQHKHKRINHHPTDT